MSLEKVMQLDKCREWINKTTKENFAFLDKNGNSIEKEDEKDFTIEDILNNGEIKLKQNIIDSSPSIIILTKEAIECSKYETLELRDNLIIYKYSSKERQSKHELVYQYFYDEFNINDYDNAYVILFCGKTGDGKSTAINAFFNIIKGIKLGDNYRFILITEQKKPKGQAQPQTDGIHLYYLKDYNNKPVILIDSQGYGDYLRREEMITEAFRYVFTTVINHINSLFSKDITENFIILSTFATKDTIKNGPAFIDLIQTDADFLNIKKRGMNEKWWFAFDSKCILDNDEDELTKYSFFQLNELYEEKVKKLRPNSIKKSAEVLENRNQLKIQVNLLNDTFRNLLIEEANLQKRKNNIIEIQNQIEEIQKEIKNFEDQSKTLKPGELEKKLEELNNLNNETIVCNMLVHVNLVTIIYILIVTLVKETVMTIVITLVIV